MAFNGNKITTYKDGRDPVNGTRALGTTFDNEFNRLYGNDNDLDSRVAGLQQQITNLIGGAPAALDTLNELAAALGDDENFSANVINRINAASEKNLVYNGIFRWFNNKIGTVNWYDYGTPDGWIFVDNGSDKKIGWNSTDEYCKIITSSDGNSMSFQQSIYDFPRWQTKLKTKKVTFKIHIKGPSTTTVKIYDGVNTVQQALAGTGSIEIIQLQLTVDAAATGLYIEVINLQQSQTIEIQKAYCNIGEYAIETLPCIIDEKIGQFHVQGNLTVDGELEGNAFDNIIQAAIDAIYAIGDIYITTDATSPATKYGGTWSVFGAGRALVSLNSGDADFDTVEETRGAKTHTLTVEELAIHSHTYAVGDNYNGGGYVHKAQSLSVGNYNTGNAGSGNAHNNIQPSIVVYMWKKTA